MLPDSAALSFMTGGAIGLAAIALYRGAQLRRLRREIREAES